MYLLNLSYRSKLAKLNHLRADVRGLGNDSRLDSTKVRTVMMMVTMMTGGHWDPLSESELNELLSSLLSYVTKEFVLRTNYGRGWWDWGLVLLVVAAGIVFLTAVVETASLLISH